MARSRPAYLAPKQMYRTPESRKILHPLMVAKRTHWGDFSDPNRRRCEAMVRTTDKRCKRDAVAGSCHCWNHGANRTVGRLLAKGLGRASKPGSEPRYQISLLAFQPLPEDFPGTIREEVKPFQYGQIVEAWNNRELAPERWHEMRNFVVGTRRRQKVDLLKN
jgi:hypothetical protein